MGQPWIISGNVELITKIFKECKSLLVYYSQKIDCSAITSLTDQAADFLNLSKRQLSPFYITVEKEFEAARKRNEKPVERRMTDDSDDEEVDAVQEKNAFPRMAKKTGEAVSSTDMTITTTYYGKEIRFKGNQLIVWTKKIMEKMLTKEKIAEALLNRQPIVKKPEDWLNYEGMFESLPGMACKKSTPFFGVLNVYLNEATCTTIKFAARETPNCSLTYCYLHDEKVIRFIRDELKYVVV